MPDEMNIIENGPEYRESIDERLSADESETPEIEGKETASGETVPTRTVVVPEGADTRGLSLRELLKAQARKEKDEGVGGGESAEATEPEIVEGEFVEVGETPTTQKEEKAGETVPAPEAELESLQRAFALISSIKNEKLRQQALEKLFLDNVMRPNISESMQGLLADISNAIESKATDKTIVEQYRSMDEAGFIHLMRDELHERELRREHSKEWDELGYMSPESGERISLFEYIENKRLKTKLETEFAARKGLNDLFVVWNEKRMSLAGEVDKSVGDLELDWLETLSLSEAGLGRQVALGVRAFIEMGEKGKETHLKIKELNRLKAEAKTKGDSANEKRYGDEAQLLSQSDENLFSAAWTPAKAEKIRDEIRKRIGKESGVVEEERAVEVGKDAEEISLRLMFLFGLAGKYNFSQSPGNLMHDAIASLYRPNDAWQATRAISESLPAPLPVLGGKDNQPFMNVSLLASFPESVGQVVLRNGQKMELFDALKQGMFDQVMWNEVKTGYGLFKYKIGLGRKAKEYLENIKPEKSVIAPQELNRIVDTMANAMSHEREVAELKPESFITADGKRWERTTPKLKDKKEDRVLQATIYTWAVGVLDRHLPTSRDVDIAEHWDLNTRNLFVRNIQNLGILRGDQLDRLRNFADISIVGRAVEKMTKGFGL